MWILLENGFSFLDSSQGIERKRRKLILDVWFESLQIFTFV